MQLPTQKTRPEVSFERVFTLIYGKPKVGKSSFCANMENALFAKTEEGLNFLNTYNVAISSWQDFLQLGALLAKEEHSYTTLVVDTVGNLYQMCEDFVCARDGMTDPSDEGFGKGFKRVKKEFHRVILKFQQMGMGVVFVAHAKESTEKSKDVNGTLKELTLLGPDLPGSGAKVVNGMVDNILYFYTGSDGKRWIQTAPTRYVTAGCRGDYKKSLPIEEKIPLDFDVFVDEYNRALSELSEAKPKGE